LGRDALYVLDVAIVAHLTQHGELAARSKGASLSDLQRATIEIAAQAVSISLSIRELIRQAHLFGAFVLLRPLVERTATIAWLRHHPDAVVAWHSGKRQKSPPRLPEMVKALLEWDAFPSGQDSSKVGEFTQLLHKLVHGDPEATKWNVIAEEDGTYSHGMGRMLSSPETCDFVAVVTLHYFSLATKLTEEILAP
jgi:hypothetical protein